MVLMTYADFLAKMGGWVSTVKGDRQLSSMFERASSDVERFMLADHVLICVHLDVGPDPEGKSREKSDLARRQAEEAFSAKAYGKAVESYSTALRYAPYDKDNEEDLALMFAGRARVFFATHRASDFLCDVDQAMRLRCSLSKIEDVLIQKVGLLFAVHRYKEAKDFVETILAREPDLRDGSAGGEWKKAVDRAREGLMADNKSGEESVPDLLTSRNPLGIMREKLTKLPLVGGANETFPAASSRIKLAYTREMGRHFVADEDISIGDVLIKETYFVNGLFKRAMLTNCLVCRMSTKSPIPCRKCVWVIYCSNECATSERAQVHAKECSFLWMLFGKAEEGVWLSLIMIMRTVMSKTPDEWRAFSKRYPGNMEGEADGFTGIPNAKYRTEDYDNVFCLYKKKQEDPNYVICQALISVYLVKLLHKVYFKPGERDVELRDFLGGLILRHLSQFRLNRETVFDLPLWRSLKHFRSPTEDSEVFRTTAYSVHPTVELVNYGCDPNVVLAHYADFSVLRAIRPIAKGEPLLRIVHANHYATKPKNERRRVMESVHHVYNCACPACENDWPYGEDLVRSTEAGAFPTFCLVCSRRFVAVIKELALGDGADRRRSRSRCPGCGACARDAIVGAVKAANFAGTEVTDMAAAFEKTKEAYRVLAPPNFFVVFAINSVVNFCLIEGNIESCPLEK